MGVIGRPHGVRGLSHVHSYTADPADLPEYGPFTDERGRRFALSWASDGVARVVELVDGREVAMRDREAAQALVNVRLYVDRDTLPAPEDDDEFYLADLIGLRIVPFTKACVPLVDIAGGIVTVVPPEEVNVPGGESEAAE